MLGLAAFAIAVTAESPTVGGRFPAVPLIAHDPYFSVWDESETLYGDWPRHWTGAIHALQSMIRVDGRTYRLMGAAPGSMPTLKQTDRQVSATATRYTFKGNGVEVKLEFMSPSYPGDLVRLTRPVTYIKYAVRTTDGIKRPVKLYLDATAELAVNHPDQRVVGSPVAIDGMVATRIGTQDQKVLGKKGDDLRIDWGYLYLAAKKTSKATAQVVPADLARAQFDRGRQIHPYHDSDFPRQVQDGWPSLSLVADLGAVGASAKKWTAYIAYDDLKSIDYMGEDQEAVWRKHESIGEALRNSMANEKSYAEKAAEFDSRVAGEAAAKGGEALKTLAVLAYRQTLAASKVTLDGKGRPMLYPKENFSNGCIGTVDVIYPMAPQLLAYYPELCHAMLLPVLEYAASSRWKFPFAPHDLGTYPLATGQVYGGGEKTEENQMPVEESANMIILCAALAKAEKTPAMAGAFWSQLTKWAAYLEEKGLDPENQLCTDDFAGHLAHNVNLSAKAIVALGAYAQLAESLGHADEASKYGAIAKDYAAKWLAMAKDGEATKLTFDKPGTWSQKYNIAWDDVLGLGLFPQSVKEAEVTLYYSKLNKYGLPLDIRKDYTKLDWSVWSSTLAGRKKDVENFCKPIVKFLRETPDTIPMTDWYDTKTGRHVGFQARSVVGGVFMPLLRGRW